MSSSFIENAPRHCEKCGVPVMVPDALRCPMCGAQLGARPVSNGDEDHPISLPPISLPSAQPSVSPGAIAPRQRPIWLVCLLTFFTFGLYIVVWSWLSWAEIKRERGNPTMHPFWHGLSLFVPIYNLFRIHAHIRTINELQVSRGLPRAIAPSLAVICCATSNGLGWAEVQGHGLTSIQTSIMESMSALLCLVVVAGGQIALNGYWQSWQTEGRDAPMRSAYWGEWATLVIGGLFFIFWLVGTFVS